jgi:hypothetical protein
MAPKVVIASDSKAEQNHTLYETRMDQRGDLDRFDQPTVVTAFNNLVTQVVDSATDVAAMLGQLLETEDFM